MVFTRNYTWSVHVSSFEKLQYSQWISSRKFITAKNHVAYTWCLRLYPHGVRMDSTWGSLWVSIAYLNGPKDSIFINHSCTVVPVTNVREPIKLCASAHSANNGRECKRGTDFCAYQVYFGPKAIGDRNFVFDVNVILEPDLFENLPFPDIPEVPAFHSLDQQLLKVLNGCEDKLSDFSIIAENCVYATDRRILANRCKYFEQLFVEGGDWVENTTKQFSAPVGKKAMDAILTFIYTDRVNIPRTEAGAVDIDLVQELVCGAHYFHIHELQKHYERPLYEHLIANQSNKNALFYFIFADRYDFKLLKGVALSILHSQFDSIEEHVKCELGNKKARKEAMNDVHEEDDILVMWTTLKENRPNNISLFDEMYTYARQIGVMEL